MYRYFVLLIGLLLPAAMFGQQYIGINVDTPSADLDIRTISVDDGAEVSVGNMDNTHFTRLFSGYPAFPNSLLYWKPGRPLLFGTAEEDGTSYSEWMRISSAGRVGIGTTNPQASLDIQRMGDGAELLRFSTDRPWVFRQTGSGTGTKLTLQSTVNSKIFEILSPDSSNRAAVFHSSDVHSNVLLVPDGGEAGVGVEDPLAKLHVVHNSNTGWPNLRVTEIGYDYARITLENDAEPGTRFTIAARPDSILSNSQLNFYYAGPNGSGDRLTILGNGNVGIGTTNPGNRLRIHGSNTSSQNVLSVSSNYAGTTDVRAIEGFSNVVGGYGTGGYFRGGYRGARVYADGGSSSGLSIGIEARATGTTGTRMGVFGSAIGGSTNWAGYFAEGNVYVTNQLRVGSSAIDGASGYKVAVGGKIIAEEMRVQLTSAWPDYVFDKTYNLMPLADVEREIQANKHLPGIPSASEVENNGIHLGEMQGKLLEKIEELTLHLIRQEKKIKELELTITELQAKIDEQ